MGGGHAVEENSPEMQGNGNDRTVLESIINGGAASGYSEEIVVKV